MSDVPYKPSNGTEGADFYETWCVRCTREPYARNEDAKGRCPIWTRAVVEHEYQPPEWLSDERGGEARCTAFKPLGRSHKRKTPQPTPLFD